MTTPDEQSLTDAFVGLTDTLVDDFDVMEFLHLLSRRCVELLGVRAAGIMVADRRGSLRVTASSSEQAHLLELFELETDEGPCVDCYRTGRPVADVDLDTADPRWRRFSGRARDAGFRAVHAVPVRLRDEVIGVLPLFAGVPGPLGSATATAARGLANVTAIGLLQHRDVEYRQILAEQLHHAMDTRVVVEQATGVLAEHLGLEMAAAFDELRRYATLIGRRLSGVAAAVADGDHGPVTAGTGGQPRILLIRRFDLDTLAALRATVGAALIRHGMPEKRSWPLVLAVHEAASNAVRHGGGTGQLLFWRQGGNLYAEISDHGTGMPDHHHLISATPGHDVQDSRGLWLINRVVAELRIDSGDSGTRLLLRYPFDPLGG